MASAGEGTKGVGDLCAFGETVSFILGESVSCARLPDIKDLPCAQVPEGYCGAALTALMLKDRALQNEFLRNGGTYA